MLSADLLEQIFGKLHHGYRAVFLKLCCGSFADVLWGFLKITKIYTSHQNATCAAPGPPTAKQTF